MAWAAGVSRSSSALGLLLSLTVARCSTIKRGNNSGPPRTLAHWQRTALWKIDWRMELRDQTTRSGRTVAADCRAPAKSGRGRRPVQFAQPQKIAVVELSSPATVPIKRAL